MASIGTGTEIRTRSGRLVKKPDRYEPREKVEDDYSDDDDDDTDDDDEEMCTDDSDDDGGDSDADSEGNLKDFVVHDPDEEI
jgi:hypothetical protein